MPTCCVINCKNSTGKTRLFRLPSGERNSKRRELWLNNIARQNWHPDIAYICENHFTADQFESNRADGRKLLRWDAVPTVFPSRAHAKVGSRFSVKRKVPANNSSPPSSGMSSAVVNSDDNQIMAEASQSAYKEDSTTLILPESVTVPNVNGDPVNLKDKPIIFIKFEPKKEVETLEDSNITDEMLKDDIIFLKRKLRSVKTKIKNYNIIKTNFKENLKLIFSSDQIEYMNNGYNDNIEWSENTINKSVKLLSQCGVDGYDELLKQKMPFPSLDVLRRLYPELFRENL